MFAARIMGSRGVFPRAEIGCPKAEKKFFLAQKPAFPRQKRDG
jgi:hypothetical protein